MDAVPEDVSANDMGDVKQRIWDAIEAYIDATPIDGINAEGVFNQSVSYQQACFVDGLRSARLAAMNAVKAPTP